jgi:non-ribosomal peptide synthetase component E (peptide arylation enzyme)
VSKPHPRLGEGVCEFTDTRDCQPLTLADLTPVLQQSGLSKQKWPEHIEHKLEMPKTASGKVRKDVLRKEIEQKLSAAAQD